MEANATVKYIRISPQKARMVVKQINYMDCIEALEILVALPNKAAGVIYKLLKSAMANIKVKEPDIKEEDLRIKNLVVEESFRIKRLKYGARGMASVIRKPTCTIKVIIGD